VISHLLDQGYSNREILTECLTCGAAGIATFRRTERELKLDGEGGTTTLPAGTLVKTTSALRIRIRSLLVVVHSSLTPTAM
jgi:hypothetical protein